MICNTSAIALSRANACQTRRLAAILAADVAGYSRLIGADEGGALERLRVITTHSTAPAWMAAPGNDAG
jgi:class 3 adenylate cyclase